MRKPLGLKDLKIATNVIVDKKNQIIYYTTKRLTKKDVENIKKELDKIYNTGKL